ncbi:MAG: hypothetical protein EBZ48_17755 [Proteobacteria bacterium]|nr:hypothetical protein [Pseudomonadota bacterium]
MSYGAQKRSGGRSGRVKDPRVGSKIDASPSGGALMAAHAFSVQDGFHIVGEAHVGGIASTRILVAAVVAGALFDPRAEELDLGRGQPGTGRRWHHFIGVGLEDEHVVRGLSDLGEERLT